MSDKTVLVAHIHPFAPSERIVRAIAPGQTVEQIVAGLGIKLGNPVAYVNGNRVIREAWAYRKAHEGDHVVVKVIPAGTDGAQEAGGKAAGYGGLLILFGLILAPFTYGASLAFTYAGMGLAGIGLGVALVATSIEKYKKTGTGISLEASLSIRGGSNQTPTLGTKIPVILGRHLVTPYYGARPYTEIGTVSTSGDTQYLRMLFCIGSGPLRISQIKIGENLLASNAAGVRNGAITCDGLYSDVEVQVYENGTNPSLYPNTVIEEQPSTDLAAGVDHWLTTAKNTDKIDVDIAFPSGLYKYSDDGTKSNHSVTVEVRRRAVGSGTAWASCTLVGTFAVTAARAKTLRYTLSQVVTAGQYEVGMRRITADDADGAKAQSIVQWSAFRSIRTSEPPVDASVRGRYVFLALKIKATSQLSGVISQLNLIAESVVPVWDGTNSGAAGWTTAAVSQNPAALYLWALRGPLNPRPIADASIDWARLEGLYASCTTKAWTCNAVVTTETRLRDILAKIASTARSTPTIRDGLYSVVVDEAKTDIAQHFTPRNVRNFSWTKAFEDLPYGVLANFISADDGYDTNQRIVPYDGYTEAEAEAKLEAIDLWGITDPGLVYKHARYRLAVSKLRPETMSFETDPEGIVCETGDLVVLSHDAIVVGHASGRVKSVEVDGSDNAISVITDELVTMAAGESYGIRFRRATGESVYTTVTTIAGETNEIIFAIAIAAAHKPATGDLFTFGEAGIETARCIVAGIEAMEDLACRVYVVDEAPGVHTADSGTIPEFVSRVSPPASSTILDIVDAPPSVEDPVSDAIGDTLANSLISLSVSTVSLKRDRTGVLSPAAIAMAGAYRTGTVYPGRFTVELSHDGGATYQALVYTSSEDESSHSYTVPATIEVEGTTYYVTGGRVRLHAAGGVTMRIGEALFTVALDSSLGAIYWGIFDTVVAWPSGEAIASDYLLDGRAPVSSGAAEGGVMRRWDGAAWVEYLTSDPGYSDAWAKVRLDLMVWVNTFGVTTIAAVNAIFGSVASNRAFINVLEAQEIAVKGTIKTGDGASDNARVAIIDSIGVGAVSHSGIGVDDLSIVSDGAVVGDFTVKITKQGDSISVGDIGPGGGKIFYIDLINGFALEAAPADLANNIFSNITTNFNGVDAIGSGLANTNLIVSQEGHTTSAAQDCLNHSVNGKDDWYLPSYLELREMLLALASTEQDAELNGFTIDANYGYYTSTRSSYATNYAMSLRISTMLVGSTLKNTLGPYTRPIRTIIIRDSFQWKENSGSYSDDIEIIGGQEFSLTGFDINIAFQNATGHVLDDTWTFSQGSMIGLSVRDKEGVEYVKAADGTLYVSKLSVSGEVIIGGKGSVPIGFVYFQLPGQSLPNALMLGVWEDISATYAGLFFRVVGGNAGAFEAAAQGDAIRNIVGHTSWSQSDYNHKGGGNSGVFSVSAYTGKTDKNNGGDTCIQNYFNASTVVPTAVENRVVNKSIRVWRRKS